MTTETNAVQVAQQIASALGETSGIPRKQIRRIVEALGEEAAMALLQETQEREANGGMLVHNGSRKRTPGGVFFSLARERMTPEMRAQVWPRQRTKPPTTPQPANTSAAPAGAPPAPLAWQERMELYQQLSKEQGRATTVKVTLIGRPGKVIERGDVILTTMKSGAAPALPKGLPAPPQQPTTYALYFNRKQWNKVREAIANPEDALIVEGWQAYDEQLKGIAVWAMNVTTKAVQRQQRKGQSGNDTEASRGA